MLTERWSWVSRHIVAGVAAELLIVSLCFAFWGGWSLPVSLAAALALIFGVRCVLSLLTFAVSGWLNRRQGKPVPLPALGRLSMMARETVAFIRLFLYYHPLEPLINRHDPEPDELRMTQTPALFVHGFYANAAFWSEYKRYFRKRSYGAVYTMNLDPPFEDIDVYADQLAARIAEICALPGPRRVILVAHSMGGLVCRAYMARHGADRVQRLITLGTPHGGTVLAYCLKGRNMQQMRPGNPWLERLNTEQRALPFSCHLSHHDNIVVPRDNARFPSAQQVEYAALGHNSMAFCGEMMRRVLEEVAAQGPNA
jgi:triacylglycerol lipase